MNKLHESLLILKHFNSVIDGRTKFCRRHIGFTIEKCVSTKLINYNVVNPLKPFEIQNDIVRECADTRITIHSYLCLNIIDMFSFDDEYSMYFNENLIDDESISKRIRKLKVENKLLRKKINWQELKSFRNIVLAHNLRDKKNNNRLSLNTLAHLSNLIKDFERAIEYCEIVPMIFAKILNSNLKMQKNHF